MTLVDSCRTVVGRLRRSAPDPPAPPNPDLAAFLKAGEDEAAERKAGAAAPAAWSPVEPGEDRARAKKAGRALVWFVLALLAAVGLRALILPSHSASAPAPAPSAVGAGFPQGQAQAVAQRWTTNYLGFNSEDQGADTARTQALAQDTAAGVDLEHSWNDAGAQHVVSVLPAQVQVTSKTAATVTVYAQIGQGPAASSSPAPSTPSASSTPPPSKKPDPKKSKPSKKPKPKKKAAGELGAAQVVPAALASSSPSSSGAAAANAAWIGLTIPMGWDGQRVVVTGLPAFVGLPKAGTAKGDQDKAPQVDSTLSSQTRPGAEAFFRAYAGSDADALQAVAAPGAKLAPLGGQVRFSAIQNWTVYQDKTTTANGTAAPVKPGVSATRSAQAVVVWQLAGGAQLTQAYDVRLENVTGSGASAWRVVSVSVNTHATQ